MRLEWRNRRRRREGRRKFRIVLLELESRKVRN